MPPIEGVIQRESNFFLQDLEAAPTLEDASEDRGSSSGVAAASKSCKNFLILFELCLL